MREAERDPASARAAFFRALLGVEGIYVPAAYEVRYRGDGTVAEVVPREGAPLPVRKRRLAQADEFDTVSVIRTQDTEFGAMGLLEVGKGCGRGCRFCMEGEIYRPVRHRHIPAILRAAETAMQHGPADRPGGGLRVRLPVDRRVDRCPAGPGVEHLALVGAGRQPEPGPRPGTPGQRHPDAHHRARGGDGAPPHRHPQEPERPAPVRGDRPDRRLGRSAGEALLHDRPADRDGGGRRGHHRTWPRPRGTASSRRGAIPRALAEFTVGVSSFVPKPWTAFQWCAMADVKALDEKIRTLTRELRKVGIHVTHDVPKWAYLQGRPGAGRSPRRGAARCWPWRHKGDWRRAFREWPRNPDFYACRERPLSERFPWDHFDVGTKRDRLETEYQRAMGLVPERTIQWKAALA